jgi:hypothetical protein
MKLQQEERLDWHLTIRTEAMQLIGEKAAWKSTWGNTQSGEAKGD